MDQPHSIRRATEADARFIAWVMLAASRSHMPRGCFDLMTPDVNDELHLDFLEALTRSEKKHWAHHAGFLIAEVDGEPAAALSGYLEGDPDLSSPFEGLAGAARELGWSEERLGESLGRMGPFLSCVPTDEPGAWIVEWVATRPAYRGRGLVRELLQAVFEAGRARELAKTQIMILSGNVPAERAYLGAGYAYVDEKRSAAFEEAVGCPGLKRFLRDL